MSYAPQPTDALLPTVPGTVAGIVGLDPRQIQCHECWRIDDPDTVGLPRSARKNPALVHMLSTLRFHPLPWSPGQMDNPRLCRNCRLARGCDCATCERERRCTA